jgi:aryl-alcohol dehydrogenase-like predicted oxidoreductase
MRYTLLGNSGLRVSEVALGTMTFGTDWGWGAPAGECAKQFELFAEAGGTLIDTANKYTNGTDRVDILWLHAWDYLTPPEEVMRALDDQVRLGKVLYLGISDTPAWVVAQMQTLAADRGWSQLRRPAGRVFPRPARGRAGANPDGPQPGPRRTGLGTTRRGSAIRQIPGASEEAANHQRTSHPE